MGNELPYMPLFVSDIIVATVTWPPDRVGAYNLCLWHQWEHGGVPADDHDELALVLHAPKPKALKLWAQICHKFVQRANGLYQNERLECERDFALSQMEKQSQKGKKGAKARWEAARARAQADAQVMPEQMPTQMPEQSPGNGTYPHTQVRTPQTPLRGASGFTKREAQELRRHRSQNLSLPACPHEDARCANEHTCVERLMRESRERAS